MNFYEMSNFFEKLNSTFFLRNILFHESKKKDCTDLFNEMKLCLTNEVKQNDCLLIMHKYYVCKNKEKEKNNSNKK